VRTSNRKYYKRIEITDLKAVRETLDAKRLSYSHANNTLIIKYSKSPAILQRETKYRAERKVMKTSTPKDEGDVDCKSQ
jgi:hypothetical protein